MAASPVYQYLLGLVVVIRGASGQLGVSIPGPVHYPFAARYFPGRYFTQGGCSQYLSHPILRVDRLDVPLPPRGSRNQSSFALAFATMQSPAFGSNLPDLDILFYDFRTGRAVLGNPGAVSAGSSNPDFFADPPPVNYTFLGPYAAPINLRNSNATWYLSTLLSAHFYSMFMAFGPLVLQGDNFPDCIQGAAWEMQGLVAYFASVLKYLLPGVQVLDGMRLNQRVLAPGQQAESITPLGVYELNALYQMDGVLPAPANASASYQACASACAGNYNCTAWTYCNASAGCIYPAAVSPANASEQLSLPPSPVPSSSSTSPPSFIASAANASSSNGSAPALGPSAGGSVSRRIAPGMAPAPSNASTEAQASSGTRYVYRTCRLTSSSAFGQSHNGPVLSSGPGIPWISGRLTLPRPDHLQSNADPGTG